VGVGLRTDAAEAHALDAAEARALDAVVADVVLPSPSGSDKEHALLARQELRHDKNRRPPIGVGPGTGRGSLDRCRIGRLTFHTGFGPDLRLSLPRMSKIAHIANLWTLTGHPSTAREWTLETKIKAVAAAGFDGITTALTPRHRRLGIRNILGRYTGLWPRYNFGHTNLW